MAKEIFENKYVQYWLEDGIVCVMYREGVLIGTEAAKEVVALRREKFPGNYPYLVYLYTKMDCITPEAKKIFASKEACEGVIRGALLVNSVINKLLGNTYLKINKPLVPSRLFTDKEEALKWLKK